jgi:hypothetical protein
MVDYLYPTLWSQPTIENFQKMNMENTDALLEATLVVLETGELTPLVKEELKYTIQSRRLANGQGELGVQFTDPIPTEVRILTSFTSWLKNNYAYSSCQIVPVECHYVNQLYVILIMSIMILHYNYS